MQKTTFYLTKLHFMMIKLICYKIPLYLLLSLACSACAGSLVIQPASLSHFTVNEHSKHDILTAFGHWQLVYPTYQKHQPAYQNGMMYAANAANQNNRVEGLVFNYQVATRVVRFKFKGSKALFTDAHAAVMVAMGENNHGVQITRGIVLGNLSQAHFGCKAPNSPAVQIESFIPAKVYLNPDKCVALSENVYYQIDLEISKDWVSYEVRDEQDKLLVSDKLNASEQWGQMEAQQQPAVKTATGDYAVPEVAFAATGGSFEVKAVELGYYLNKN